MLQANRGKIAIAFAIGLAIAAYSQLRVYREHPTYALETTLLTHYADEVDDVPKYQSDSAEWSTARGRINDLSKFLARDTGNHIGRPYLVFAIDRNATSETVRSALTDLTKRQICYAGILDFPPDDIPTDHMAVIFRIVSVNEKDGTVHRCEERINVTPG
ncbi:hypothetical protein [Sphingopyxis sp.]|uniref:hypothetical protein n=1 Tax=Sphingopyxis sp. TaxID=1908224 RepID=UPI0035B34980